jgi:hypothetical protein
MSYDEELPLFQVLHDVDAGEFVAIISRSNYPCLADSALMAACVTSKFKNWQALSRSAPVAFDDDGTWNASVTIPVILVVEHDKLLQACHSLPHFEASEASSHAIKHCCFYRGNCVNFGKSARWYPSI